MRKLKLQVQMTINGFVGGPNRELDWMNWNWSDDIKSFVDNLTDTVDTILLGRKMTDGFMTHWTNLTKKPDDEGYEFAKKMVGYQKVVFTKTLGESNWKNTVLAKGDLTEEVNRIKNQSGKDVIVYGGAEFVSNLIAADLIDEYYLFINPSVIKNGLTIFSGIDKLRRLKLSGSVIFDCGIVAMEYKTN